MCKVCKDCNLLSGDKKILEEDGRIEVAICRANKDYFISAENDDNYVDIIINYCPFCGRKLKED